MNYQNKYLKKKCKHCYALEICKNIIKNIDNNKDNKILVLGVALGSIIIHLANSLQKAEIHGVDITDEYFNIVRENLPKDRRVTLIKDDAKLFLDIYSDTYNIIISDIFNLFSVPDFIMLYDFLNKIYQKLTANEKFLINTIKIDKNILNTKFINAFPNCFISIKSENQNNFFMANLITIIQK